MIIQAKKIFFTTICLYILLNTTSHILAESSTTAPFKFIYASTIGTDGYTINNPGYYVLVEDVAFEPTGACSAITTATNNVTINLNNHSIYQNNSQATVIGINIQTGLFDVTIKNGTLSGFTYHGIYVNNNCNNLSIENLNINNATCTTAMSFAGTSGNEIYDCIIKNCNVTEITCSTYCLYFYYCNDIKIINSNFNNNITTSSANYIIYINYCNNCNFSNCKLNKNSSVTTTLYIIRLANSYSCLLENCLISKNNQTGRNLWCLYIQSSNANIIKNCTISNNSVSRTGDLVSFIGVYINYGIGNIIDSCFINNNTATTNSTQAGMWALAMVNANSRNNIVRNCSIMSNKVNDTSETSSRFFGFDITAGSDHYVENCQAINNEATTATSTIAYGFRNQATSSVIKNCRSFGNTTHGFYNTVADAIFVGCSAGYNGTANYATGAATPQSAAVTKLGDNATVMEKFGNANINA